MLPLTSLKKWKWENLKTVIDFQYENLAENYELSSMGRQERVGRVKNIFFNKKTVNKKMPLKNPKTPKADFSQSSLKVTKLSKF